MWFRKNLRGIRVVKAFVREDYEIKKFQTYQKKYTIGLQKQKNLVLTCPYSVLYVWFNAFLSWFGAKAIVVPGNAALGLTTGRL